MYKVCPVNWKSQLQTEIYLASTESEYTVLSYTLREMITLVKLLKEMKQHSLQVNKVAPTMKCWVFEDNSRDLEMSTNHKYRPRTKYLNVKLHHFKDYVTRKEISIKKINTKSQLSDYLTKPVNEEILCKLRKIVTGW